MIEVTKVETHIITLPQRMALVIMIGLHAMEKTPNSMAYSCPKGTGAFSMVCVDEFSGDNPPEVFTFVITIVHTNKAFSPTMEKHIESLRSLINKNTTKQG